MFCLPVCHCRYNYFAWRNSTDDKPTGKLYSFFCIHQSCLRLSSCRTVPSTPWYHRALAGKTACVVIMPPCVMCHWLNNCDQSSNMRWRRLHPIEPSNQQSVVARTNFPFPLACPSNGSSLNLSLSSRQLAILSQSLQTIALSQSSTWEAEQSV